MKLTRYLVLVFLFCPAFAYAQRPLTIVGGVVTANVADTNDFQVTLTANVTGVTLTSTTGSANTPVTPATGYQITMRFVQDATGSRTVAFGGNISTTCTVNATANAVTICRWQYTALTNAWADAGGGGITPNTPIPLAQQQGPSYNVVNYGAKGDAKKTLTAVTTNASSTITDATNSPWLVTDIGKKIYCVSSAFGTSELSTTISTISAFNSTSSISISPATGNGQSGASSHCVWFTQKDTTAMLAAGTAAQQALAGNRTSTGPTLAYPSNVYCPPGGYVVDAPFFVQIGTSATLGVNFIGAGRSSCTIYLSPDATAVSTSWIMNSTSTYGFSIAGFTVDCSNFKFALAAPGMRFNAAQKFYLHDIGLETCGTSGDATGLLQINNAADVLVDGFSINATSSNSAEPPFNISSSSGVTFRHFFTTNPGTVPSSISSSGASAGAGGPRNGAGSQITIENSVFDEGGVPGMILLASSSANFIGVTMFSGTATVMTVDANSSAYLTDVNFVPFGSGCSGGNRNAITMGATALVVATQSTLQGCGASTVVTGPATAFYYDLGGNDYRNCTGAAPCALATLAQSFGGGVFPVFPLPSGATTQLGGKQTVSGTAPTCSVTGAGSTATCTVDTGSTDAAGKLTITANGAGIAALGTFTLTYTTGFGAYGTNGTNCSSNFMNGTGAWNVRAGAPVYTTLGTTTAVANWDNNAVVLTAGSTYKVTYTCYGQ